MSRQAWIGSFAAIVVAILLIVKMHSISEFMVHIFFPVNLGAKTAVEIGQVLSYTGSLYRRSAGSTEFISIKSNTPIYHLDYIKVESMSNAIIEMSSNWQIQLNENTIVAFEFYRLESPETSPVLMSVAHGTYGVVAQGKPGLLYVMKDQKVLTPELTPQVSSRIIVMKPQPQMDQTLTPTTKVKAKDLPDKLPVGDDETLSSSYIEQVLNSQASSLSHCQLNSARDNIPTQGSLLLSFTILPSGQIESIKVLQDSMNNNQLSSCAVSVIERVQFKSFLGLPITLSYPLEFK